MSLGEFITPEITDEHLQHLSTEKLISLLEHKTRGLLAAARINLIHNPETKTLIEEIKKIQHEIEKRGSISE